MFPYRVKYQGWLYNYMYQFVIHMSTGTFNLTAVYSDVILKHQAIFIKSSKIA